MSGKHLGGINYLLPGMPNLEHVKSSDVIYSEIGPPCFTPFSVFNVSYENLFEKKRACIRWDREFAHSKFEVPDCVVWFSPTVIYKEDIMYRGNFFNIAT